MAQLVKNPSAIWETLGLISGLERSPGEGNGYPLQYSALENSMDRRVWQPTSPGTDEKTKAQRGKEMLRVMQLVKSEVEFLIWV